MRIDRILTIEQLEKAFAVRLEVFVEEQKVPLEEELDEYDLVAHHFLATDENGIPAGTARLLVKEDGTGKVGRVAVRKCYREQGVGRLLMEQTEALAHDLGLCRIILSAQTSAIRFYEKLDYIASGGTYLDAGIEHRDMSKRLKS